MTPFHDESRNIIGERQKENKIIIMGPKEFKGIYVFRIGITIVWISAKISHNWISMDMTDRPLESFPRQATFASIDIYNFLLSLKLSDSKIQWIFHDLDVKIYSIAYDYYCWYWWTKHIHITCGPNLRPAINGLIIII